MFTVVKVTFWTGLIAYVLLAGKLFTKRLNCSAERKLVWSLRLRAKDRSPDTNGVWPSGSVPRRHPPTCGSALSHDKSPAAQFLPHGLLGKHKCAVLSAMRRYLERMLFWQSCRFTTSFVGKSVLEKSAAVSSCSSLCCHHVATTCNLHDLREWKNSVFFLPCLMRKRVACAYLEAIGFLPSLYETQLLKIVSWSNNWISFCILTHIGFECPSSFILK